MRIISARKANSLTYQGEKHDVNRVGLETAVSGVGRGGAKVLEMVQNQTFEILMTRSKIQDTGTPMWFTCDVGEVENSPQGGEEAGIGGADLEKEDSV